MMPLSLPVSAADDDNYLVGICRSASWAGPHEGQWLAAYSAYRAAKGDPWVVLPALFNPDVSDRQYALYDSRKSGSRLKEIRDGAMLLSCPMCGSPTTGTLDHYLPRTVFPEFSVMASNLVPACSHCNSGGKRAVYRGVGVERFIHPYFDTIAAQVIWRVMINPPFEAATFEPVPMPDNVSPVLEIVAFHLKQQLGKQFALMAERLWATLPLVVHACLGGCVRDWLADVTSALEFQLRLAEVTSGANSWHSAFFRGVLANQAAVNFVTQKVCAL